MAGVVPLARGWLRQFDTARDGLFFDGSLDAAGYLRWLRDSGVSYVALSGGRSDWASGGEAALLRRGVPGVREVWSDRWWRLFEVADGGTLAGGGTLVSSDRTRMVVDVPRPGRVQVAVWWSRWSSVLGPGGCVRAGRRRRLDDSRGRPPRSIRDHQQLAARGAVWVNRPGRVGQPIPALVSWETGPPARGPFGCLRPDALSEPDSYRH